MADDKHISKRFRGFLPVIVDVETGGFNPEKDALLELAAVTIKIDEDGMFSRDETFAYHIEPFKGANLEESALEFTGIDPGHPFRFAVTEEKALNELFKALHKILNENRCSKAVLVGHNAAFDLSFLQAATNRCRLKNSPFHKFTCFDTATLAAIAYGQTVLARAMQVAKIDFSEHDAHSAIYDAEKTTDLFCKILNTLPFDWG